MPLLFDLDDTLLDDRGAQDIYLANVYSRHSEELALDRSGFAAAWRSAIERYFPRYVSGAMTFVEQRRARVRDVFAPRTLTDAEADAVVDEFVAEYEASWRLFPDVMPALDALRGETLGVITNGNSEQQMRKLERMQILDRFSVVLVSEAVGYAKPAPEIFAAACTRLGCEARSSLFIGDDWDKDVEGARGAGLVPIWLRRDVTHAERDRSETAVIASLAELLRYTPIR